MASAAWFTSVMAAIRPSTRFSHLFSLDDGRLAQRGFNRAGLSRSYITGIAGF